MTMHHFLEQISDTRENWNIRVRVTRMWDATNLKSNNELLSLDMILLDEKGEHIHATVRKNLVQNYRPLMLEGHVYSIRNFKVVKTRANYRPVHNSDMITFTPYTSVKEITEGDNRIQLNKFEFVNFNEIKDHLGSNTYLIDVVGKVVAASKIEEVQTKSSMVKKREIELKDKSNNKVKVTLWAGAADQISNEIEDNNHAPKVIIVTSTMVKEYKGEVYLSSSNATKIFLNLQITETADILESSTPDDCQVNELQIPAKNMISDEEWITKNRVTISDVSNTSSKNAKEESMYTIRATIMKIETKFGWHYISCPTHRTKVLKESNFWCKICKKEVQFPLLRYKIQIRVGDYSGSTTIVLFDKVAEKVVGKPLSALIDESKEDNGNEDAINYIQTLLGNAYVFLIKLNDYNITQGFENYAVTKVFDIDFALEARICLEAINQMRKNTKTTMENALQLLEEEWDPEKSNAIVTPNEAHQMETPRKKICIRREKEKNNGWV